MTIFLLFPSFSSRPPSLHPLPSLPLLAMPCPPSFILCLSLTCVYLPYISRMNPVDSHIDVPLSYCNSDCSCDKNQWEPICGGNGVTYISPCLAGCKSFRGDKKPNNTVSISFHFLTSPCS